MIRWYYTIPWKSLIAVSHHLQITKGNLRKLIFATGQVALGCFNLHKILICDRSFSPLFLSAPTWTWKFKGTSPSSSLCIQRFLVFCLSLFVLILHMENLRRRCTLFERHCCVPLNGFLLNAFSLNTFSLDAFSFNHFSTEHRPLSGSD